MLFFRTYFYIFTKKKYFKLITLILQSTLEISMSFDFNKEYLIKPLLYYQLQLNCLIKSIFFAKLQFTY